MNSRYGSKCKNFYFWAKYTILKTKLAVNIRWKWIQAKKRGPGDPYLAGTGLSDPYS